VLKFVFWSLLAVNVLLLAYGQGVLGSFKGAAREPARLTRQVEASKMTLITPEQAQAAVQAAEAAKAQAAAVPEAPPEPPRPTLVACTEVGPFNLPDGRRFEAQVAPLNLREHMARDTVTVPEVSSHMVYIPSLGSREAAERRAQELQAQGVTNYFILNESSPLRWSISLGVFKSEQAAQTLLAALQKQGVEGVRVHPRQVQASRTLYRFRDIEPAARARLDSIVARFPQQSARACR
jgi:hypothetical protein